MPLLKSGPSLLEWQVYAGDSNEEIFLFTLKGAPLDLTGASLAAQARRRPADPGPPAAIALIVPIDEALGQYSVSWDGNILRSLMGTAEKWIGAWDLEVTMAGAALPKTILYGPFTIIHDVTRPL